MSTLSKFDTPAALRELSAEHRATWSDAVSAMVRPRAQRFAQFYDPTADDTPDGLEPATIAWPAFPARVQREDGPGFARWERADSSRDEQDEYCEWSVERNDQGKITRITFTTEVPEYWGHIAQNDPDLLIELYRKFVDESATLDDLLINGTYNAQNNFNNSTTGRLAHLIQGSNNLDAAVALVAEATVLRQRSDGTSVTDRQELVACGNLGDPFRNSDPQIAEIVNDAASLGTEITLLDPLGLYLDGLITAGMRTPDGANAAEFWTVERGTPEHAVRASFAVNGRSYVVGDITLNGRLIERGAQVADVVRVRTQAVAKPGTHQPTRRPCEA